MRLQKIDSIILIFAVFLIGFAAYQKHGKSVIPKPEDAVIVVPDKSNLTTNIFYDEYDKAKKIAIEYNLKLVLVFGANWCPYCKDLKKDVDNIKEFKSYIVCFINIDNNKNLVQQYKIKSLPTSVIIYKGIEEAKKTGYKNKDYCEWLQENLNKEISWSSMPI